MPQTMPAESSRSSFAGLLASLARQQEPPTSSWDEELADDIATIGYEQSLRTQAHVESRLDEIPAKEIAMSKTSVRSRPGEIQPLRIKQRLKTASITIRLSEAECAQLRQRAAESGLTISAYLRSCTLEVESLRAQVKETLAKFRQSGSHPSPAAIALKPSRASILGIWNRLWPFSDRERPPL
jgi:predicted DNA binding CopG/RHH family protein